MIENLADKIADKLPSGEQYSKNQKGYVGYIFMLVFFLYFFYSEFLKKDDCGEKIAVYLEVSKQKDEIIKRQNKRIDKLETTVDVKNGTIELVKEKLTSDGVNPGGTE